MFRKQWIVLSGLRSLRIASKDGAPGNEYRIKGNEVEFRAVDARGKPFEHANGKWRILQRDEIQLHFVLRTPVADWLDKTFYPSSQAA
ncbi:MAG TPA: hypothetical protein VKL99_02225 [Candidatus Angelobacter sp.]|nr:hypothetical protein [Candidatus Angelobacter sp.]